jgi:hypothetical protein
MGAKFKTKLHLLNIFFWFFEPFFARLASSLKKCLYDQNQIFLKKFKNILKNAEFHADFKSVEKVL